MSVPIVYAPNWQRSISIPASGVLCPLAHRYAVTEGDDFEGLRRQVERLVATVPEPHRPHFVGRLRAKKDQIFRGALAELLAGGVFQALGHAVDWTPKVGAQTPDLSVRPENGPDFLFAVGQGEEREEIQRQRDWVCQQLLDIETKHKIIVWDIVAPMSASLAPFFNAVRAALTEADAASPGPYGERYDPENAQVFEQGEVRIEFNVLPHRYAHPPCL